ncbi:hypothetical protein [Ornithinimicrobium pratense]|uniref:Uncharacterized protein n=1 Tax=Ornithinimicrobium pratense TaxID=2593973 RepID=A0A5J6V4M8_9MICO|nr:hypothetical protein [Ornithinimicrobium pratense]QFG68547.1 hypothetical protein FY030_07300 [Ornithinimicrobium pratense]
MSRAGKLVRVLITLLMLGVFVVAQVDRHDDWWPLGMMGQYAQPRDPDGEVVDTFMVSFDPDGRERPVVLRASRAGITRVELELNLHNLQSDPTRLDGVARRVTHTHGHQVAALEIRQRVHTLRDGRLKGDPDVRTLLRWEAP